MHDHVWVCVGCVSVCVILDNIVNISTPMTTLLVLLTRGRYGRRNSPHRDCHPADLALHTGQSAGPVPPYWRGWTSSGGEYQMFHPLTFSTSMIVSFICTQTLNTLSSCCESLTIFIFSMSFVFFIYLFFNAVVIWWSHRAGFVVRRDRSRHPPQWHIQQKYSTAYINEGVAADVQGLDDLVQLLGSKVTFRPTTALWVGWQTGSDWGYLILSSLCPWITQKTQSMSQIPTAH